MIAVRKAEVSDAEVMAKTEALYLEHYWTREQIESEIVRENVVFLTAEVGGEYAGHLSGETAEDECEVSNIVVAEKFRRQGVAQKLFEMFFEELSSRGAWDVYIVVRCNNTPAINLYEKLGFKPVGKRKGYYKGVDGTIMRKILNH